MHKSIKEELIQICNKNNIFLKRIIKHHHQGYISTAYTAQSNQGKIIILLLRKSDNQLAKAKRVIAASKLFKNLPVAKVYLHSKLSNGQHFLVQEFLQGKSPSFKNLKKSDAKKYARLLTKIHNTKIKGFGYIVIKNGEPQGPYKNWFKMIKKDTYSALNELIQYNKKTKDISQKRMESLKPKFRKFFKKYKKYLDIKQPKLLHGDFIAGNILIKKGKISGLVDFEWMIAGDIGWEFALYLKKHSSIVTILEEYAKINKIPVEKLKFKMDLYRTIKALLITNAIKPIGDMETGIKEVEDYIIKLI